MAEVTLDVNCDECGAEMELDETWTGRSPPIPIIGTEVEKAEFACTECLSRRLFVRETSGGEWEEEETRPFA